MPARKRNWTPEIVRQRIRTSMLVNRLTKHVRGEVEMAPTQVTAALGLLKKALPDLSAIEHTGEIGYRDTSELSDGELAAIATASRPGTADEADRAPEPDAVH